MIGCNYTGKSIPFECVPKYQNLSNIWGTDSSTDSDYYLEGASSKRQRIDFSMNNELRPLHCAESNTLVNCVPILTRLLNGGDLPNFLCTARTSVVDCGAVILPSVGFAGNIAQLSGLPSSRTLSLSALAALHKMELVRAAAAAAVVAEDSEQAVNLSSSPAAQIEASSEYHGHFAPVSAQRLGDSAAEPQALQELGLGPPHGLADHDRTATAKVTGTITTSVTVASPGGVSKHGPALRVGPAGPEAIRPNPLPSLHAALGWNQVRTRRGGGAEGEGGAGGSGKGRDGGGGRSARARGCWRPRRLGTEPE